MCEFSRSLRLKKPKVRSNCGRSRTDLFLNSRNLEQILKPLMKQTLLTIAALFSFAAGASAAEAEFRSITIAEYRDKVYAAWLGQVTGAAYGFPFEGQAR